MHRLIAFAARLAVAAALPLTLVPLAPAVAATGFFTADEATQPIPGRNPRWGGYRHNELGYGSFTSGPDGGFGGYPPGSPQAAELRNQQRYKCQAVPEQC